jgi:UDP-N-acetylmuramoylalanine--D-glutamate ligase
LAATAAAHALGVEPAVIAGVLREAAPGRHRVELVATIDGVAFVDDSKATNPHAAAAAARGFPTVVLIAGGRNKGLNLDSMVVPSVRAVVAIGESADEVERAFSAVPVTRASTMSQAVAQAAALANVGDTVLLAPGCASFDWYSGYAERGDDFVRAVGELAPTQQAPSQQAPSRESASHG